MGPGRAIKQSELRAISAFLWCMSATAFTSPTVSPVICGNKDTYTKSQSLHPMKPEVSNFKHNENNRQL